MDGIKIQIIDERSPYYKQVIELGDANTKPLGFCTRQTFLVHAKKKSIIIAKKILINGHSSAKVQSWGASPLRDAISEDVSL